MIVLEAIGIKKNFGGVVALSNANLRCYQGRITGLLGANGSGKSTMSKNYLRCLSSRWGRDKI